MIFIENKYTKIYYKIIENAKNRNITGYTEKHHIVPKSLGGLDIDSNLVPLTAKEHYIVHLLLTKMVNDPAHKQKMWGALWSMTRLISPQHKNQRYIKSSIFYHKAKENIDFGKGNRGRKQSKEEIEKRAASLKGKVCSDETKRKIGNANKKYTGREPWNKGKKVGPMSDELRHKHSLALKGIPKSDQVKENMKLAQASRSTESYARGWKHSEEALDKLKTAARNRPIVTCPHCQKEGSFNNMKRYHFDNCKSRSACSST